MSREVLIIAHQYLPYDPRVRKQLDALADHGIGGDVICLREEGQARRDRYRSFRLHRLPVGRHRGAGLGTYVFEYASFLTLASFAAARLAIRHRYPLVMTHTLPDPLVFAATIPRLLGARVVMDMHEFTPELFQTRYGLSEKHLLIRLMGALEQASCAFADVVLTVHHPGIDMLEERGVRRSKIAVVMNTAGTPADVGVRRAERTEGPFRLVHHGTLVNQYDFRTALDALELVAADGGREVVLRVIGTGPELAGLEERARSPRLDGRVELIPPVPLDRISGLLRECDAGIVPMHDVPYSHVALPMKALECVVEGLPVIANPTRILRYYFSEDAMCWVPHGDARALADAIRRLRDDAELRGRLAARAVEQILPLSWEEQGRTLAAIAGADVGGD